MNDASQYVPNGISVVIPNYNGAKLLDANLPSLIEALILAGVPYQIIVPDDASNDNSITFLKSNYPAIELVENKINRGFSPNINSGIALAKYELIFLMNSDVKLVGDYFSPQFGYFSKIDTFGVSGRIIGYDDDSIQDAAKSPAKSLLKVEANLNIYPTNPDCKDLVGFFLSGANALIKAEKLKLLEGFDEGFAPFYGEDLDLCLRAWRVGWKCYYHHQSVCRHPASITIKKYNKRKFVKKIVYKNRFYFHQIHLAPVQKVFWYSWVLLQIIFKTFMLNTSFLKGFLMFIKQRKMAKESIQKLNLVMQLTQTRFSTSEVIKMVLKMQNEVSFVVK